MFDFGRMLIHDLTLQPTDRAPVASNRLILAQRRSLQSPKADAGGINQHRNRGQYLGVDFLHFGNRSDFSPKKKTITSTTSARLLKRKSAVLRVRQRNTNRAYKSKLSYVSIFQRVSFARNEAFGLRVRELEKLLFGTSQLMVRAAESSNFAVREGHFTCSPQIAAQKRPNTESCSTIRIRPPKPLTFEAWNKLQNARRKRRMADAQRR